MYSDDDLRRAQEIRRNSQDMSSRDLNNAARDAMLNRDVGAAAGYVKAWQDKKERGDFNQSSGGGGCFITTAVCDSFGKADDCYELTAFRNFRDKWLANQSDGKSLIAEYYAVAPKIVAKINQLPNAAETYKNIWTDYLSRCLNFIEAGDNLSCKKIYVRMVQNLKAKFLG